MDWRLILDPPYSGSENMARDEALLLGHADGEVAPTVRFYDWSPSCVSLGRFQKWPFDESMFDNEPAHNIEPAFDIVRRPTGGRAVMHADEITYCAVVREELLPVNARSIVGAYRWISAGLIAGLENLQISAQLNADDAPLTTHQPPTTNCFATTARCDLTVRGRKLIGAAQCRKRGVVLQHGSILLGYNAQQWSVLGNAAERVICLRELGVAASRDEIIRALCAGMETALKAKLVLGSWTPRENGNAEKLRENKYSQPAWTRNGELGTRLASEAA